MAVKIPCSICSSKGTVQQDRPCPKCGGAGEIDAPEGFHMSAAHLIAMFNMIINITDTVGDIADKVDDVLDKLTDIKEVVDDL